MFCNLLLRTYTKFYDTKSSPKITQQIGEKAYPQIVNYKTDDPIVTYPRLLLLNLAPQTRDPSELSLRMLHKAKVFARQ